MRKPSLYIRTAMFVALVASAAAAQQNEFNYDENKVPDYTLPDPLVLNDGSPVSDAETWRTRRRPEILQMFETHVYGKAPKNPGNVRSKVTSTDPQALGGKATRKEISRPVR